MFVKVLKDINFATLSHGMNCKKGEVVEIDDKRKNQIKAYADCFEVLPNYVIPTMDGDIDGIEFKKGEIVKLPLSTYTVAVRVYPERFKKLSFDEYKNLGKEVKKVEKTEKVEKKSNNKKKVEK